MTKNILQLLKSKMGTMHMMGSSLERLQCSWNCTGECIDEKETPPYYVISKEEFDKFVEENI